MDEQTREKKCFVITPIGNEGTEIRRHIDGIIDAAISPVIKDKFGYELEVAHRIDAPGNIPKQVITNIHESDLVIANLTENNPNVMYELALRHCFGTVAIIIAEKGTKIPADIVSERTIFYVNDAQGVLELKKQIDRMVMEIEKEEPISQQGPVYDALRDKLNADNVIKDIKGDKSADAFSVLLNKIEDLEKEMRRRNAVTNRNVAWNRSINDEGAKRQTVEIITSTEDRELLSKIMSEEIAPLFSQLEKSWRYVISTRRIRISTTIFDADEMEMFKEAVRTAFSKYDIENVTIRQRIRDYNDI